MRLATILGPLHKSSIIAKPFGNSEKGSDFWAVKFQAKDEVEKKQDIFSESHDDVSSFFFWLFQLWLSLHVAVMAKLLPFDLLLSELRSKVLTEDKKWALVDTDQVLKKRT